MVALLLSPPVIPSSTRRPWPCAFTPLPLPEWHLRKGLDRSTYRKHRELARVQIWNQKTWVWIAAPSLKRYIYIIGIKFPFLTLQSYQQDEIDPVAIVYLKWQSTNTRIWDCYYCYSWQGIIRKLWGYFSNVYLLLTGNSIRQMNGSLMVGVPDLDGQRGKCFTELLNNPEITPNR